MTLIEGWRPSWISFVLGMITGIGLASLLALVSSRLA